MFNTQSNLRARSAFTLIELMIAVAIVSLLASMAVVGFDRYRALARRSEVPIILDRLVELQIEFYQRPYVSIIDNREMPSCFVLLPSNPDHLTYISTQSTGPRGWTVYDGTGATSPWRNWGIVGYPTREPVHFFYGTLFNVDSSTTTNVSGCGNPDWLPSYDLENSMRIYARGDLDGDNLLSWTYRVLTVSDGGDIRLTELVTEREFE